MRVRLILSFILLVVVSIGGVVLLARNSTANEVRAFMYRGGMTGEGGLVQSLEDYYAVHGSWDGVETLLVMPGHGAGQGQGQGQNRAGQGNSGMGPGMMGSGMMMGQRLRLADADGYLLVDTAAGGVVSGEISRSERGSALELKFNGRTVGYLLAEGGMGYSRASETFLLNRLTNAAVTAAMIAGGVALLLGLLLAYSLMRPVRELTDAANRLEQGDLSTRVKIHGSDELAVLGQAFNQMAGSLQQAQESRRAMTADIAHELRTPLAVQRANLEALQDGVYPLTPENLAPVLEQNLLLTRLVDDLRTLAMADAGQLKLERVATDLAALVGRCVERFQPQADARQVALSLACDPAAAAAVQAIPVDPQRIEQILGNLLSNALRYTPEGGTITTTLALAPGGVSIEVRDSGPGIPADALPHIFERFYRADRSRSRSDGGAGLGLAIARQLAEAHGGSLRAENHPQGGALFTLTLRLAV